MSNTSDPDSIERELDQTRSRLSGHLDALQGRFSPGQVLDDLMGYFRGNEGADIGRTLLDNVRANPLPAAITGIGLAWLMATNPCSGVASPAQPGSKVRVYRGAPAYGDRQDAVNLRLQAAEQGVVRRHDEDEPGYAARLDDARGQALGLARQAQETTGSYAARISEALAAAKQSVVAGAHDLRDQVGNAAAAAQSFGNAAQGALQQAGNALSQGGNTLAQGGRAAGQAGGNLVTTLADNPVLLGALGLAAGALLGALLPQSEQEEEALGGVAKGARDTARSLAQGVVDRGGQVAGAVRQAGQDSAQAAGLTGGQTAGTLVDAALSGELAGNVRKVAEDVLRAGDETVRKEVPKAG